MGIRNLRAICPNCGGKIHTQPKGFGHFTWANSWMLVQTGSECQHCGIALNGKVGPGNKAVAAEDADKSWWEREMKPLGTREVRDQPALPVGPELSREQKRADVIDCEIPSRSPDEVFAAAEHALDLLEYKSSAQDVAAVLASRQQRILAFKTGWSLSTGSGQRMEVSVDAAEPGSVLHLRRQRKAQLYDWGEKNEVTRRFLGALQTALAEAVEGDK